MTYSLHQKRAITFAFIAVILFLFSLFLRTIYLEKIPAGLNWDETAYAYNAFSILRTGKDEWGYPHPLFLRSFGEYKPALMSYVMIPFLLVFPDGNFGVRAVNALLGSLAIVATAYFVKKLTRNTVVAVLTAATLAITPMHLHFTRIALDSGFGHALLLLGMACFVQKKTIVRILGALLLVGAMYGYNAERIVVPLLMLSYMGIYFRGKYREKLHEYLTPLLIILFGACVFVGFTLFGNASARARTVTIFTQDIDKKPQAELFSNLEKVHLSWAKPLFPKSIFTIGAVARQYGLYWRPDFLFFRDGTVNASPILGFPRRGNLLEIFLPFFLIGIYTSFSKRTETDRFFLLWALIGAIPGAVTSDGPHTGRALTMLPALNYFIAIGMMTSADFFSQRMNKILVWMCIFVVVAWSAVTFLIHIYLYNPESTEWIFQGEFRQVSEWVGSQASPADQIFITRKPDPHALLFYAWYARVDPLLVQQAKRGGDKQFGWLEKYGNVSALPDRFNAACVLQGKNTIAVLELDAARPLPVRPSAVFRYANRFGAPPESFRVYMTNWFSDKEKQDIANACLGQPRNFVTY